MRCCVCRASPRARTTTCAWRRNEAFRSIAASRTCPRCRAIEGRVIRRRGWTSADKDLMLAGMVQAAPPPDIRVDVVIIGGGMVGMTLAAALGGAGISVALLDQEPAEARTAAG